MAALFRNSLFFKQLRQFHKSAVRFSVPTFDMNTERKAFLNVLPEVINSVITDPKITEMPEVRTWMKKLLEYMLGEGNLGRGLMVSVGYKMFEEPENLSEETQHSARVLGWCLEMLQAKFIIFDDVLDGGKMRRGKPCWHLQPNVGLLAVNDSFLIHQAMMDILDTYFGQTPIYAEFLRYFNESVYRGIMGQHLDLYSGFNKEKNNIEVFNMNRVNAVAINKTAYYTFRLPIFASLLLVKNGKQKATNALHDICMGFGKLMLCQDDYLDVYGNEIITGKTGRDIQEGKSTWVAVTALQHCNDAQRAIFKEYYGSKDPEHVKRIKQLYDDLHLPQLYEHCERNMYDGLVRQIYALPSEGDRNFLLGVLNAYYKRVY